MENGDEEEHIAGSTSITRLLVAVRLRPLSQRELDRDNCTVVARAADSHQVQLIDPIDDDDVLRKDRPREWLYEYDYVFPESTDQVELYQKTTKSLIDWVIEGYNATVFAYGATGAGKTYTMLGTEDSPGVIVLALVDLFEHIEHHQALPHRPRFDVTMSYLEIYNENIRDLLSGSSEPLDLREDAHRGVVVSGISSVIARSAEEVLGYLEQGNKNRIQEATGANEVSSRSHAVLQVQVSCKHINAKNATVQRYGKLSMIDLAGSERAAETQNRGIRMIEGANINRSLLALANCINALVDSKKGKYVNFRDSKLTRLLKDSLGGNCRTVMISNISPANHNFDETHNTLKYANRARSIKTKVSQHVFHRTDPCSVALNAIRADLTNIRENLRSPPQLPSRLRKRTHTDPPPSAESSARPHWDSTPSTAHAKHKPDTYITDMRSEVQQIFAEQVHIRNEIIGADAEIWECLDAIGKAKRDVEGLTRRLDKSDEDQREGGATGLERAKMKVGRHEKRKIGASRKRGELVGRLDELDERLQELFQRLSKQDRKEMYWMVRSFYLELENTDLLNNFREATQTLWEKEAVLKELTKQVKLLEKLSNLQRERLDKVSANSSALVSFYNEVSSRQRQRGQEEKNDRSQMGSVEGLSERLTKRIGSIVMMCSARSNSAQEPTRLSRRGNKKPSTGYKPTTIEDKSDTFEERTTNQGTKPNSNPSPERAKGRRQTAKRHPRLSSHREENEASFSPRPSSPPPAPRSRGRNRSVSRLPSIQQRRNPRSRDISTQRSKTNEIPIRNTNELPPLVKERPRTKRGGTKSVELPELRQSERRRSPLESKE